MDNRTRKATLSIGAISFIFGITALCRALSGNLLTTGGFASAAGIAGLAAGISAWRGGGDD